MKTTDKIGIALSCIFVGVIILGPGVAFIMSQGYDFWPALLLAIVGLLFYKMVCLMFFLVAVIIVSFGGWINGASGNEEEA